MGTQPKNTHGIQTQTQPNPYSKFGLGQGITLGYPNFGYPIPTIIVSNVCYKKKYFRLWLKSVNHKMIVPQNLCSWFETTLDYKLQILRIWNFLVLQTMVGIGYPKFGYPRVIPGPEPNFGYGLGWVCVWISWVFSGWVPIKFKILGFFGYYPRVPVRIGYPKFGHPWVIPKQYYDEKCSYIQRYKYY